jgi:Hemopexin
MYEYYTSDSATLAKDDIEGIEHIYGKKKIASTLKPPSVDASNVDRCAMDYDAIAIIRTQIHIFNGKFFWRPDSSDSDRVEIATYWQGLPKDLTHVDAVYENDNEDVLIFIDKNLYIFEGRNLKIVLPIEKIGLRGVKKVDMIFKWNYNRVTYIFSGESYYRFDERVNAVMQNYKKEVRNVFQDVYDMNTALTFNKTLYFFKGKYFYEFNDKSLKLNRMDPSISAYFFMKCTDLSPKPPIVGERWGKDGDVITLPPVIDYEDEDHPEKNPVVEQTTQQSKDSATTVNVILSVLTSSVVISRLAPVFLLNL